MRFWLRGDVALPDTVSVAFPDVVPDDEHRARLQRGVQHMKASFAEYDAAIRADQKTYVGWPKP